MMGDWEDHEIWIPEENISDPLEGKEMGESEVHKLAKQMMLRDLRGHLDDWEEGKYTYLDMGQVMSNLGNIFQNWRHYNDAALIEPSPKQLPLFDPPGKGSVRVNF